MWNQHEIVFILFANKAKTGVIKKQFLLKLKRVKMCCCIIKCYKLCNPTLLKRTEEDIFNLKFHEINLFMSDDLYGNKRNLYNQF